VARQTADIDLVPSRGDIPVFTFPVTGCPCQVMAMTGVGDQRLHPGSAY
jgi:hypothetical protein